MSEQIKITIVMHDEKPNSKNDGMSGREIKLTQESDLTLMPVLLRNGLMDGSFCGGRGDCGRCVVQFLKGAPLPTGLERSRLEPEELRQGYRLACVTRPKMDCTVRIVETEKVDTPIVTEVHLLSEDIDLCSRINNLSENQKSFVTQSDMREKAGSENGLKKSFVISEREPGVIQNAETDKKAGLKKSGRYIIAVDLGTTTIAMQLKEAETGGVADTYCEINPQRKYGTDVLARIQASVDGQGEELRRLVCGVILRGLGQFAENLFKKADEETLSDELVPVRENGKGTGVAAESVSQKGNLVDQGHKEKGNAGKILCMCIAGNTAMEHLLLGLDVSSLGRAPFLPVEKGLQSITAARLFAGMEELRENLLMADGRAFSDMPVYVAPCMSAFVGGDIVAGLYALGLLAAKAPEGREKSRKAEKTGLAEETEKLSGNREPEKENGSERHAALLIDLGTNGEMAITDGQRMIVTATAAGPAFEGDGTMMGTDRIALTAQLLRRGILDETGLMAEPYFTEGVRIEGAKEAAVRGREIKNYCYFTQKDVRGLQMAKAAIRAGVEILWEEMGRPGIEKVFLAGGFGYYLDVEAAVAVGLLPAYMRGRVQAAGNTSLAGAYELGRDLCEKRLDAAALEERTCLAESRNLAETERFEELYLKYMNLGEN